MKRKHKKRRRRKLEVIHKKPHSGFELLVSTSVIKMYNAKYIF